MVRDDGEGPVIQEMADDDAPVSRVTGEPVAEVHRIGNEVKVITELPGITEEALRLDVKGNTLVIDAGDADHHYRTSAALPPVDIGIDAENPEKRCARSHVHEPSGAVRKSLTFRKTYSAPLFFVTSPAVTAVYASGILVNDIP